MQVPIYEGAIELMEAGVASSLQANNEQALADFTIAAKNRSGAQIRLLADPQTAGGLLAGIPADRAEACVATLQAQRLSGNMRNRFGVARRRSAEA